MIPFRSILTLTICCRFTVLIIKCTFLLAFNALISYTVFCPRTIFMVHILLWSIDFSWSGRCYVTKNLNVKFETFAICGLHIKFHVIVTYSSRHITGIRLYFWIFIEYINTNYRNWAIDIYLKNVSIFVCNKRSFIHTTIFEDIILWPSLLTTIFSWWSIGYFFVHLPINKLWGLITSFTITEIRWNWFAGLGGLNLYYFFRSMLSHSVWLSLLNFCRKYLQQSAQNSTQAKDKLRALLISYSFWELVLMASSAFLCNWTSRTMKIILKWSRARVIFM